MIIAKRALGPEEKAPTTLWSRLHALVFRSRCPIIVNADHAESVTWSSQSWLSLSSTDETLGFAPTLLPWNLAAVIPSCIIASMLPCNRFQRFRAIGG